ncbi:hypothetical protein [Oleiagrimonas sp. MCCC 1A03011]|jgi:hypothetical protein|uniref:hypothetical protein n=1 Tax=Oleiagrimonas sp. MCCC 1A03011 TaxID=1926883 RepID=UPI000DC436D0|nr:hypothetical protein [Oleiagrimonas sp. MCCC 1A03011]RAP59697.1 hypothetical protein BTJ49_03415 [Oleiagrimonas sp. MCCC 1A03011]
MAWNPIEAEALLNESEHLQPTRLVKKIAGFVFPSGRELVLSRENDSEVTLYVDAAPGHMPDVQIKKVYEPTDRRMGRHADIESVARSLGYSYKAIRVHVKSRTGLELLLHWLRYA